MVFRWQAELITRHSTESTSMNQSVLEIRSAKSEDRDRILSVHRDAFGAEEGEVITNLVAEMLDDPSAVPINSLVATHRDQIVGHVLLTSVRIEPSEVSAQILAPLAVARDHQGIGIGTKLVKEAFMDLQSNGVELVFVLGYPDYYSRFGFAPAGARGFQTPYPILPKNADAWMVKELSTGALERYEGTVRCCKALGQPQYWHE